MEEAEVEDWEVFERKSGTTGKRQRTNRNNCNKIVASKIVAFKNICSQKSLHQKIGAPLIFEVVHTSTN